jgi:dextranase
LPDSWQSDILVTNPGNTAWQSYIFDKTNLVYNNLNFDGWHLDQLGDRGKVYDYNGNLIPLNESFTPFLQNLKLKFPNKKNMLNAVAQYGQSNILSAQVDVAYTEIWDPRDGYKDLAEIIQENNTLSGNKLNTVLAAYMNYDKANSPGFFNTPGVLLTDAVIFAFGGSHLELGEHMLAKEYFPNNNISNIRGGALASSGTPLNQFGTFASTRTQGIRPRAIFASRFRCDGIFIVNSLIYVAHAARAGQTIDYNSGGKT